MNLEDTIVAISSPPGAAVRGIVRLSGSRAVEIADGLFKSSEGGRLVDMAANRRMEGAVLLGEATLPAALYLFRAPRSYTREDLVELHLLGAPGVLGWLVELCLTAGARRAAPGEFTARAYLAGAFDLSQVHAIAGMIAARSDHQVRAAERLLHGALGETARAARGELDELVSLVEASLDFADEPIEFITPDDLQRRLALVRKRLEDAAAAGLRAERWTELPRVVLIGSPNVGKSSLFNRLIAADRAIASPLPGTTRDVLSAVVDLGGVECLLFDIAGLAPPRTALEADAQEAARRAVEEADLWLDVRDAGAAAADSLAVGKTNRLVALNKADLLDDQLCGCVARGLGEAEGVPVHPVSALTGAGCAELRAALRHRFAEREDDRHEGGLALVAEHRDALERAIAALGAALTLVGGCGDSLSSAELIAAELRTAAKALGTLVGEEQTEEMLGRIFARFCIGK